MTARPLWPSIPVEIHGSVPAAMDLDPDLALLEAWRNGDRKAADALLSKYYRLIRQNVLNKVAAESLDDVVQNVITALVERRDHFRSDATFRTYALSITRHVIGDFYRRHARKPVEHVAVFESSVRDLGAGPTTLIFEREHERLFLEALRSIPLDDQFILELYYWEHMSGPELAQILELEEPAIRSRLRRAKDRLKAQLQRLTQQHHELADTMTDIDAWAQRLRDALKPYLEQTRSKK